MPVLDCALQSEALVQIPDGWRLMASETPDQRRLDAQLWYVRPSGQAHIALTVKRDEKDGIPSLWCSIAALLALQNLEALNQAPVLERCLAWAWLKRP